MPSEIKMLHRFLTILLNWRYASISASTASGLLPNIGFRIRWMTSALFEQTLNIVLKLTGVEPVCVGYGPLP